MKIKKISVLILVLCVASLPLLASAEPLTPPNLLEVNITVPFDEITAPNEPIDAYTVTVDDAIQNGTVTPGTDAAPQGAFVVLTVTPDKGLTLETISVSDADGNALPVENLGARQFGFTMPKSNVTVSATFMEDNSMLNFFVDVKATDYFYDAVLWAAENDIAKGVDAVSFAPNLSVTRADAVTLLWRAYCSLYVDYFMQMNDVPADEYYTPAVRWALAEKITTGTSENTFSPKNTCTRAELITFLWRAAGSPVVNYYMQMNDVPSDAYYAEAVRWALAEKITTGTSENTFSPNNTCTRAEIITLLWRSKVK